MRNCDGQVRRGCQPERGGARIYEVHMMPSTSSCLWVSNSKLPIQQSIKQLHSVGTYNYTLELVLHASKICQHFKIHNFLEMSMFYNRNKICKNVYDIQPLKSTRHALSSSKRDLNMIICEMQNYCNRKGKQHSQLQASSYIPS